MNLLIEQRVHRGQLQLDGLLWDETLIDQQHIRQRILAAWSPGFSLYYQAPLYVLLFDQTVAMRHDQAAGAPLVSFGRGLSSFPPDQDLLDSLDFGMERSVLHLRQGELLQLTLSEASRCNPADWLQLTEYALAEVSPLGRIEVAQVKAPLESRDNRTLLSGDNADVAASSEQQAFVELLKQQREQGATNSAAEQKLRLPKVKGRMRPSRILMAGMTALVAPLLLLGMVAGTQKRQQQSRQGTGTQNTGHQQGQAAQGTGNTESSYGQTDKPPSRIKQWISNAVMRSALGRVLGKRQAQYLNRMMEMFDKGDLEQALRHAVPLDDVRDLLQDSASSMGTPSARNDLSLTTQRGRRSGTSMHLGDQAFDIMRQMYEQSFKRLDQQQRYQEAAFVLADLLREYQRAVDYLNQHGLHQLAAELAEGQKLDPRVVIRQWVLAGNIERAVFIARLTQCYGSAIHHLQAKYPKLADQLRWELAQLKSQAGLWAEAVELAWPLEEHRDTVTQWIDMAIQEAGSDGAVMLLRRLSLLEQDEDGVWLALLMRFIDDGQLGSPEIRKAMYDALCQYAKPVSGLLQQAAAILCRHWLSDLAEKRIAWDKLVQRNMLALIDDALLKHEIQSMGLGAYTGPNDKPLEEYESALGCNVEKGKQEGVCDVYRFANGRILMALGEVGAALYDRRGVLLQQLMAPCHQIIPASTGNQALLLARRDGYISVSRFKVGDASLKHLGELQLDAWSADYDGLQWLVSEHNRLLMLDVHSTDLSALWSVNDMPGRVSYIAEGRHSFAIVVNTPTEPEVWLYEKQEMQLRERNCIVQPVLTQMRPVALSADGVLACLDEKPGICRLLTQDNMAGTQEMYRAGSISLTPEQQFERITMTADWLMLASGNDTQHNLKVHRLKYDKTDMASFVFSSQDSILCRQCRDSILLYNSTGRLVSVSLKTGQLEYNLSL